MSSDRTFNQGEMIIWAGESSDSKIDYRPLPGDDPKQQQPDITLAKKLLDWKPTVQLKDGLVQTIEYFKDLQKQDLLDLR